MRVPNCRQCTKMSEQVFFFFFPTAHSCWVRIFLCVPEIIDYYGVSPQRFYNAIYVATIGAILLKSSRHSQLVLFKSGRGACLVDSLTFEDYSTWTLSQL